MAILSQNVFCATQNGLTKLPSAIDLFSDLQVTLQFPRKIFNATEICNDIMIFFTRSNSTKIKQHIIFKSFFLVSLISGYVYTQTITQKNVYNKFIQTCQIQTPAPTILLLNSQYISIPGCFAVSYIMRILTGFVLYRKI